MITDISIGLKATQGMVYGRLLLGHERRDAGLEQAPSAKAHAHHDPSGVYSP